MPRRVERRASVLKGLGAQTGGTLRVIARLGLVCRARFFVGRASPAQGSGRASDELAWVRAIRTATSPRM